MIPQGGGSSSSSVSHNTSCCSSSSPSSVSSTSSSSSYSSAPNSSSTTTTTTTTVVVPCTNPASGGGSKLSWTELRQSVRDIRCRFSYICKKVPSDFTFRTIETERGTKVRLYFLSMLKTFRETTLVFADLPSPVHQNHNNSQLLTSNSNSNIIPTFPLLEPSFQVFPIAGMTSKEEQLQWERKRLVTWGISTYEVHEESGRFIFPACGSLFTCQDGGQTTTAHFPSEMKSSCCGARLNPQTCPLNVNLVSYICNGDIWVQHTGSGHEAQLTFVHKGSKSVADDPQTAGLPAYVTQEEFHRYVGLWWQPFSRDGIYRILYEEVDESEVDILYFVNQGGDDRGIEEFRFPRAGTRNAKSSLKLIQFQLTDLGQMVNIRNLHTREGLDVLCPSLEYLARVGWTPDGNNIWLQCVDRRQVRLDVLLVPLTDFVCVEEEVAKSIMPPLSIGILIQETNESVWINVHDVLHFLPTNDDDTFCFIWADEQMGFRRLVLVTAKRTALHDATNHIWNSTGISATKTGNVEQELHKIDIIKKIPLTNGEWEILDKQVWVDEVRQVVYFMGMQSGPLEKHLYVVSLNVPGYVRQITVNGFSHMVTLNKECNRFVSVYSSISSLPTCEVFAIEWPQHEQQQLQHSSVHNLTVTSLGFLLKQTEQEHSYSFPQLFVYNPPQSSDSLFCMVFTPPNLKPGHKYPTVLSVYGGPEVQLVNNSFKGMRHLRLHMLAARGYVVVVIDSRGSCHRGVKFESHIKCRMGTVEIPDQVEALQWLAEATGYIDLNRVAIHGWSYGGYLSLMALAQRPDVFKIAIAGAPVTSWVLYDTAYTERYMDLPNLNPQGYATGSVLSYIHSFPNEENRLLIIHGLIDENVHFQHTSQLISALVKAGKPYQLQIYPGERHSLRHLDASEHYETSLLSFLQQHL